MHTINGNKLLLLRPSDILFQSDRPKRRIDEYELHALAASILANGVLEPVCVRQESKDKYVLICGERRLRAAKAAGLRRVPCVIHKTDEKGAAIYSLVENLARRPIDFFEQAERLEHLMFTFNMTKSEISGKLGISQSAISAKLRLLKIPEEMRAHILSANLTEEHAELLSSLDKKDMPLILDAIISENLSAKQARELLRSVNSPEPKEEVIEPPVRKSAIGDIKLFSNSLAKLLLTMQNSGLRTSLNRKEAPEFVEYKIRIQKAPEKQLSFSGI